MMLRIFPLHWKKEMEFMLKQNAISGKDMHDLSGEISQLMLSMIYPGLHRFALHKCRRNLLALLPRNIMVRILKEFEIMPYASEEILIFRSSSILYCLFSFN